MKSHVTLFSLFLLLFSMTTTAQDYTGFEKKEFREDGKTLPYRILLPKNYQAKKKYPLVLFLHGSGERGNDNEAQLTHGATLFLQDEVREKYPAIVIFPQCAPNSTWARLEVRGDFPNREFVFYEDGVPSNDMLLLEGLLKQVRKDYKIDKKRMYVGGLSMGGFGTFELVRRNPKLFAAAFPICGGANPKISDKMKKLDWWVFHGEADLVVPEKYSAKMVAAMKELSINVKYTAYPGVEHNSWDNAFAEPDLLPWLFSKSK